MYSGQAREKALQELASGASLSEVSRATGISRSTLRGWRDSPSPPSGCPRCDGGPLSGTSYSALLIVEQHPADFLRGLFHSDGSRVRN
jgi:hypothetical protein